ncbi:siderophore-interacting protein [Citrobacter sp. JGM124]|uniref:siderophore-interacting protein n=1 Tax=Citrobacter sp. JGM124 TaxID=2799789 RepID=UPI001BA7A966|nr:siderophore-interacting protein [Citrobacter sp. JGM124]MBS0847610.1 siderophore-interacting protein [Citrobacter sp. JGM124]
MAGVQGYRLFNVRLARKSVVSPSLLSLVFTGPEVRHMKCDSPDQRIKLLLPSLDGTPSALSNDDQWYDRLQSMDKEKRPILRTYTLRQVDRARQELTVEFVSHGTEGPASAFAVMAEPGAALQIVAPDAEYPEDSGGYEWSPPADLRHGLIVADETALPAARGILELLAKRQNPPQIQAFFEVPEAGDCVDLDAFHFAKIHWLPRAPVAASHGDCLINAVKERIWLPEGLQNNVLQEEAEGELLWDKATSDNREFYGWVAAESTVVKMLRRYLIGERGVAQETINFMAYWARARARN